MKTFRRDGFVLYKGWTTDGRIYSTYSEAQLHNDGSYKITLIQIED